MGLLARIMQEETPTLGIHLFCSLVSEYARGKKTKLEIETALDIASDDTQWVAITGLIDNLTTEQSKILKSLEIKDVLLINQGDYSVTLYPDAQSIKTRLGI